MKQEAEFILNHRSEFMKSLKSQFQLIHMSNFFFRDFHYGVMSYLKDHRMKLSYAAAEGIAVEVGEAFVRDGVFKKIDHQSWLLNYAEFALPKIEKKAS